MFFIFFVFFDFSFKFDILTYAFNFFFEKKYIFIFEIFRYINESLKVEFNLKTFFVLFYLSFFLLNLIL